MHMYILGMESSCDETSAAVVEMGNGVRSIRSNIVASQIEIHRLYGGVVPVFFSKVFDLYQSRSSFENTFYIFILHFYCVTGMM